MHDDDRPNTTVGTTEFLCVCHFLTLLRELLHIWLHLPINFQMNFFVRSDSYRNSLAPFFLPYHHHMEDAHFYLPSYLLILQSALLDPFYSCWPQVTQHNMHNTHPDSPPLLDEQDLDVAIGGRSYYCYLILLLLNTTTSCYFLTAAQYLNLLW